MSKLTNRFEGRQLTLAFLGVIISAIMLAFFIREQSTDRQSQRVELAMQFVQKLNEPDYVQTREKLWAPFRNFNLSDRSPAYVQRIASTVEARHIEGMKAFYSSVLACKEDRCDEATIDRYFKEEIKGFWCLYRTRLLQTRERLKVPEYAEDLRRYAGSCRP